jgi:Arc/MetJ-type ribon-helix-helix transcriptional regulator
MMNYQLPPDLDLRIQSQLALGIYSTPAEVLNDALDALDQRNEDLASIQRGLDDERSGRVISFGEFDRQIRSDFGLSSPE